MGGLVSVTVIAIANETFNICQYGEPSVVLI